MCLCLYDVYYWFAKLEIQCRNAIVFCAQTGHKYYVRGRASTYLQYCCHLTVQAGDVLGACVFNPVDKELLIRRQLDRYCW